ncbi:helix-turn-helix transcriptional regulator [Shewanella sp. 10N.286.48.B5]|uniref:helix-turn-helix transcriptional regulator n=1 Tax=Shewanella sp. 10N.286.48.B5 TaxID=1880834 RepID=UPI000C821670|nr:helix-turn-helix transcriptional regulator [Shewanella sp. 10N.286.48.B5]PMH86133.1 DNA-binding protein [Shewanella sp. 10N.286.48.B5]
MTESAELTYMSVKQVSEYLSLNEKKVYSMANDRILPATKVTGKWLFPKILIDRWIMESCHSGMLSDRMHITGSDDPLLSMLVAKVMSQVGTSELVSYSSTGSSLGLDILSRGYADVCALHWGKLEDSNESHLELLKKYPNHQQWLMVHGFNRKQGLMMRPETHLKYEMLADDSTSSSLQSWRWIARQSGSGSQQHLEQWLAKKDINFEEVNSTIVAQSERELAGYIARHNGDIGFGCQSVAFESGLSFVPVLTESFDFVMPQGIYFRRQLQQLLSMFQEPKSIQLAATLGGYDLTDCGKLMWDGKSENGP